MRFLGPTARHLLAGGLLSLVVVLASWVDPLGYFSVAELRGPLPPPRPSSSNDELELPWPNFSTSSAAVVISEATRVEVKELFRTRYLGEVTVKGKEVPVKIYTVLDDEGPTRSAAFPSR